MWIRKMTVPQAEIDTFHIGNCFRRILPLSRRRCLWTLHMVCESAKWRSRRLKLTLFTYVWINAEIPPATGKYRLVCPKQDPGTNRFLCWIPRVFLTAATYFFANVKKHNSWKIMVTNEVGAWSYKYTGRSNAALVCIIKQISKMTYFLL